MPPTKTFHRSEAGAEQSRRAGTVPPTRAKAQFPDSARHNALEARRRNREAKQAAIDAEEKRIAAELRRAATRHARDEAVKVYRAEKQRREKRHAREYRAVMADAAKAFDALYSSWLSERVTAKRRAARQPA